MRTARERALPAPSARRPAGPSTRSREALHPHAVAFTVLALAGLFSYLAQDWLAGLAAVVLAIVWKLLWQKEYPPVLPVAVSYQWLQVSCGIFYFALTGRELEAMYASDYRTMVLMGLGCVLALSLGLAIGVKWGATQSQPQGKLGFAFSWRALFISFLLTTFLSGFLRDVAWTVPGLTQGLLAVGYIRLGLLFLMFRRLVRPRMRWEWFLGLLAAEMLLGFSGFFASFREPLMLAALALIEAFDPRSVPQWMRLGGLAGVMLAAGILWMGVRATYRAEYDVASTRSQRLERFSDLSSDWVVSEFESMADDLDQLIDRVWAIYYPALAVRRVPEVLPHENGAIMWSAIVHLVTPRLLFPEKGILQSDSELVRKYSGVFVAGTDENTSIAFGYAAESYVDFGVPWMFLPSLVYGLLMGRIFRGVFQLLRHREIAVGFACVFFWLTLFLFERSWVKTLGNTGTLLVYLGGIVWLLDWWLSSSRIRPRRVSVAFR